MSMMNDPMAQMQPPPMQMPTPPIAQKPPVEKPSMSKKEQQELVQWANGLLNECVRARFPFEKEWYYNLAFYFGRQWVEWIGTGTGSFELMRLYEPAAPKWRVRLVTNKVRRYIRTELTKLTKEKTQYFVLPESSEDQDIASARAAEQISEYLFEELGFNYVKRRAIFWALLCGTGFIKDYWDPNATDSSGEPGAIKLEVVNPWHLFFPDLEEEDVEKQPYAIHAMAKNADWTEEMFGIEVPETSLITGGSIESKFFSAMGLSNQLNSKKVHVRELWCKPCKKFPNGAHMVWTNETLLSLVEYWPFDYPDFPFTKIDHIPTGRFYGASSIVDLIPLQKEYNRTRSQLMEAKNRMAKPQLLVVQGSIDPSRVTSEPGLMITYKPGYAPPTPIPLSQIPQYVIEELDRTSRDMDSAAGQELANRPPPGVEAASAIAYLQEQNDTLLYHTVASMEEAIQKVGKHLLTHADTWWDAPRLIKVVGQNNAFEAMMFSNGDVRGNTDFRVEAGSSIPRSLAAKQAFITELAKMQIIPPDKVLRYLEMAETNRLYEESQVSARQAQRENLKMAKTGQPVPLNEFDDDNIHDLEHSNFMRSQQFEMIDPQIQPILIQHLQMHRMKMQGGMVPPPTGGQPQDPNQLPPGTDPSQMQQPPMGMPQQP